MIECPNCQTTHLPGTLFCEKCGTTLTDSPSNGKPTDLLSGESIFQGGPGTAPMQESALVLSAWPKDSIEIPTGSFALWIADSNRWQIFEMDREILIGRTDSTNQIFPDLDLTADGGIGRGVSRRHSRITFRDGVPYVEDLKSTNHTYLNGVQLEPLVPQLLYHDDELCLGAMLLRVKFPQPNTEHEE